MKINKSQYLKILVHVGAWLPILWLFFDYTTGNLSVNPIQEATQRTGKTALILLVLALSCTPLNTMFGLRQVLKVRRALGLYAFLYAMIHFFIFIGLDYGFDWRFLYLDIVNKRYVWVGAGAFIILSALAATSFKWWMKRLGKNWKHLHRLVYIAGFLVIIHYTWARKGDIFRLQGDIWQPLAFGLLVAFLLVVRIPVVRRGITKQRGRIISRQRRVTFTGKKPSVSRSS